MNRKLVVNTVDINFLLNSHTMRQWSLTSGGGVLLSERLLRDSEVFKSRIDPDRSDEDCVRKWVWLIMFEPRPQHYLHHQLSSLGSYELV